MANVITLGGVSLNPNMVWSDQFQWDSIEQNVRRTLGGGLVIFEKSLISGRAITLEATGDQGWLTASQINALIPLSQSLASTYTLNLWSQIFTVAFSRESGPALSFTPLIHRIDPVDEDYFTGQINLITV